MTPRRAAPRLSLTRAQDEICKAVEELDGGSFKQDTWCARMSSNPTPDT